jgi:hypothetical protein
MKVFFTLMAHGVLHSMSSSWPSLQHSRQPSAVLSVVQLGAPQSDPRGDEPADNNASALSIAESSSVLSVARLAARHNEPRGDDPGESRSSCPQIDLVMPVSMGSVVIMGMWYNCTGIAHMPGGPVAQRGAKTGKIPFTMVCPFA